MCPLLQYSGLSSFLMLKFLFFYKNDVDSRCQVIFNALENEMTVLEMPAMRYPRKVRSPTSGPIYQVGVVLNLNFY